MVLGFVVIIYPNKYISYPDVNDSNSPQEKPQMNEGFTNETIDEISGFPIQASNISDVKTIESGNISSTERFHYQERLKDLQDEGVEGMTEKECSILSDVFCSCYLTYNIHTFLNLLLTSFNECNFTYFPVIITAMVTIVTTILLVIGVRKVNILYYNVHLNDMIFINQPIYTK